jgi:hypothetical protein
MMDRVAAGETVPAMAPQLGNVAAYYIGDFNHAIYEAPLPLHEHGLSLGNGQAEAVLRTLGKDPHAYVALMEAQQTYALLTVDYAFDPKTDVSDHYRAGIVEQGAASAGHVVGILTEERANAAYESELDPNLHKNNNVDLVGDYSTSGNASVTFEWTWKWKPPKPAEDRGGGWRNSCSVWSSFFVFGDLAWTCDN